jgi:hypothetical protein
MITRKPLDVPPAVARAFVEDMRAFFAEKNRYKQDEIALRQLHAQGASRAAGEGASIVRHQTNVSRDEGNRRLIGAPTADIQLWIKRKAQADVWHTIDTRSAHAADIAAMNFPYRGTVWL